LENIIQNSEFEDVFQLKKNQLLNYSYKNI